MYTCMSACVGVGVCARACVCMYISSLETAYISVSWLEGNQCIRPNVKNGIVILKHKYRPYIDNFILKFSRNL